LDGTNLSGLWKNSTGWIFDYNWVPEKIIYQMDTYNALNLLYSHSKLINAKRILELGVGNCGVSTWCFLKVVRETGGRLTSVDIRPDAGYCWEGNKQWTFVAGDSLLVDIRGPFDVVLIDTSHTYEQTKGELERFVPMLRKDGLLFMHDTDGAPVMKALNDYMDDEQNLRFIGSAGIRPRPEMRLYKKTK